MSKSRDVWIIGGAKLVKGLLDIIDEFHLSRIQGSYDCDTFLPKSLIIQKYELAERRNVGVYMLIYGNNYEAVSRCITTHCSQRRRC